jgi:hypothetical protein
MRAKFVCPACAATVTAPPSLEGKSANCPGCGVHVAQWPPPVKPPSEPPPAPQPVLTPIPYTPPAPAPNPFDFDDAPPEPKRKPRPPREPEPEPDPEPPPRRRRRERAEEAPPGAMLACYILTAAAAVTLLMPCIWLLAVPLAAAAGVTGLYISNRYGNQGAVTLCIIVSIGVLVFGLGRADDVNRALQNIGRQP